MDCDVVVLGGQFVGELAGAVRAVVVRHEYVRLGDGLAHPADDGLDVLRLVVGRDDHQRGAERTEPPLPAPFRAGALAVVHCCPFMSERRAPP